MKPNAEMIAAGADVLRTNAEECFGYVTTWAEEIAEKVFLAMSATNNEITPKMIEAAANVIQGRAGDDWTRIDWAMSIAEAALEAAFDAKVEIDDPKK